MGFDEYRKFKGLYESMRKGKKTEVIHQYAMMSEEPSSSMTVCEDTVLHMAINMRQESIAREILKHHIKDRRTLIRENVFGDTILHEAASTNMTTLVKELLEKEPLLLSMPNKYDEMPLFKAAQFGHTEMFKLLAGEVGNEGPEKVKHHLSRSDKTTILHMTILAEFFDLAYVIAKKYPGLVAAEDGKGKIALQLLSSNPSAFKSGSSYGFLKSFINYCVPDDDAERNDSSGEEDRYKGMLDVDQEDEDGDKSRDSKLPKMLKVLVDIFFMIIQKISSVLRKMNQSLWSLFRKGWPVMENIRKEKRKHESALRLAKLLIADDTSWEHISTEEDIGKISVVNPAAKEEGGGGGEIRGENKKQGRRKTEGKQGNLGACVTTAQTPETSKANNFLDGEAGSTPTPTSLAQAPDISKANNLDGEAGSAPTPTSLPQAPGKSKANNLDGEADTSLLLATSNGIVEIVEEILDVYPQAVEHVSRKGQNIMHVAIKNRQKEIFNMVKKMEIPMTRLVRRIDENGYTLLHHVAVMQYYSGGTMPGPALQLQEELHWFDRVQKIIPPHYEMHRSRYKDETAEEFFNRTHTKLLKEAQEWLKRTSESCSTVAVLIATVAFAAAYTVPGGSNQDTGLPVLLHDPIFLVFTVMDVLSLASSLTSVVMFLSILTSPFQLQDFSQSLPRKLTLGFSFLFFSVAVMMLTFTATILLIVHLKKRWTTLLIYTVAFLPVSIFAVLQVPLYLTFMNTLKTSINLIRVPINSVRSLVRATLSSICKRR
ncbi:PREDICTED: uncharacterized protein LOC105141472 isoform X1 [Populus euphratica]|uniref:Uncharacterized protein LOC105141472 isoform X1 n=1 Tax=Populus euphratica TaxID=75702 RepID=A0AAJ6VEL9_POPEU|nr:PREDICTED: uncharacterized protein LOC105141472 isoform X1 [Populus euphratica]